MFVRGVLSQINASFQSRSGKDKLQKLSHRPFQRDTLQTYPGIVRLAGAHRGSVSLQGAVSTLPFYMHFTRGAGMLHVTRIFDYYNCAATSVISAPGNRNTFSQNLATRAVVVRHDACFMPQAK